MPRGRLIGAILASSVLVARAWAQQGVPPPTPVPTASETTATERGIAAFEAHRYAEAKKVLGRAVAASCTSSGVVSYLWPVSEMYFWTSKKRDVQMWAAGFSWPSTTPCCIAVKSSPNAIGVGLAPSAFIISM